MGRSTADIPVKYLMPAAKDDFIAWVSSLPVTIGLKRYLLATWQRSTQYALSADDRSDALDPD